MRALILVLVGILMGTETSYAQTDSLRVFMIGVGEGEKYRIIYEGDTYLQFKTNKWSGFKKSFSIPYNPDWKVGERMYSLYFLRKSGLSLWWRTLGIVADYQQKKYLIIKRDFRFRNSIAFDYEWSDMEPDKPVSFGY